MSDGGWHDSGGGCLGTSHEDGLLKRPQDQRVAIVLPSSVMVDYDVPLPEVSVARTPDFSGGTLFEQLDFHDSVVEGD